MDTKSVLRNDAEALRRIADEVARKLVTARVEGCDIMIDTPIAFPGGRRIGIKILGGPVTYVVTDDGNGTQEAELMGAGDIWRRAARKVAKELELRFNEYELFEAEAPADRLPGYVSIVANAAALAMIRTVDRFAELFELRRQEALAVRLQRVFGAERVAVAAEVVGASTKKWQFDALVRVPGERQRLFDLVKPAPVSVAATYTKFDDVARLRDAPSLTAVLAGEFAPDDKALLARAAKRLLSNESPDDAFRLAA